VSERDVRLNEYDADEWFDVCRQLDPKLTREQFDEMWREFQELKARNVAVPAEADQG
jgi:hypothetical protein